MRFNPEITVICKLFPLFTVIKSPIIWIREYRAIAPRWRVWVYIYTHISNYNLKSWKQFISGVFCFLCFTKEKMRFRGIKCLAWGYPTNRCQSWDSDLPNWPQSQGIFTTLPCPLPSASCHHCREWRQDLGEVLACLTSDKNIYIRELRIFIGLHISVSNHKSCVSIDFGITNKLASSQNSKPWVIRINCTMFIKDKITIWLS